MGRRLLRCSWQADISKPRNDCRVIACLQVLAGFFAFIVTLNDHGYVSDVCIIWMHEEHYVRTVCHPTVSWFTRHVMHCTALHCSRRTR